MKKIFLGFLLATLFSYPCLAGTRIVSTTGKTIATGGIVYIHDLLLDDNQDASDVVSNDGTANDWTTPNTTTHDTEAYHSIEAPGGYTASFDLGQDYRRIQSADNWVSDIIVVDFYVNFQHSAGETGGNTLFQVGDGDGTIETNEIHLKRAAGIDELYVFGWNGSAQTYCATSDFSPIAATWYHLIFTIDCSQTPWSVSITSDGSPLTIGAFSAGNPENPTFASHGWVGGTTGTDDSDAYICGVKIND